MLTGLKTVTQKHLGLPEESTDWPKHLVKRKVKQKPKDLPKAKRMPTGRLTAMLKHLGKRMPREILMETHLH